MLLEEFNGQQPSGMTLGQLFQRELEIHGDDVCFTSERENRTEYVITFGMEVDQDFKIIDKTEEFAACGVRVKVAYGDDEADSITFSDPSKIIPNDLAELIHTHAGISCYSDAYQSESDDEDGEFFGPDYDDSSEIDAPK